MKEFKNKKVLITGGANGIGLALVESFADLFNQVIFIDRDKAKGKSIEKFYKNKRNNVSFYYCDLLNFEKSNKTFKKIIKKHKNIDFLINNARSGVRGEILKENEINWNRTLSVILKNSFFFSQEFIRQNRYKKNLKAILNISSIVTKTISMQSPSYHAAKSGLEGITKYLAVHGGKYNIRVNSLSPGFIIQKRHYKKFFNKKNYKYRNWAKNLHPMKNIGTENDIVKSAIFLLSENSKFINGSIVELDGGASKNNYFQLQNQIKK